MEGMMEPPPPGIVPNFPPLYPFKWQQKIMPEPHPNHLRSMGLPPTFGTPRRSNPGYGGYQYCRGYEEGQGFIDHNIGYHGSNDGEVYNEAEYSNDYCHSNDYGNQSDEYGAYDDDETWQGEGEWYEDQDYGISQGQQSHGYDPSLAPIYGAPAPAPRTKNHYYNLAPKTLSGASGSANNGYDNNTANIPPQRSKKQEPSEGKKNHLRKVYGDRYCEGCNYGFHSLDKFLVHLESHVKCPFTGCGLETTIERLDEHLTVAHILNPSASKQIDTAEYIRQRRNNFPSVHRAQLKTALAEQQKKRGEILAMDHRWEKMEVGKRKENNIVGNSDVDGTAVVETATPEVDSFHVDSHEYEPVNWTEPSTRNHARKQDGNAHAHAKRKLMESSRQRAMVKRHKEAFHRKKEVMVEREVDVLCRIPAFCGIEEYREDAQEGALASTCAQNDASQSEPNIVFHISDDEDDIPSTLVSSSPLKNNTSFAAQSRPNTSDSHLTNPVQGLGGEEASRQAIVTPAMTGSALRLLLGDYGTDSEEEEDDSENTCPPTVGDCVTLLCKPVVSVDQETVLDLHDNSKSREQSGTDGGTSSVVDVADTASGSNTHSFGCGGDRDIEGSSPDAVSTNKNVALEASSESEEEILDAKVLGCGEGSKRRRRGKRGKKKKKFQVSGAEGNLGESSTIHNNNNNVHESSKCNGEGISTYITKNSIISSCLTSVVAPHLKPFNKKEIDFGDECLETAPRERLPTTRWTEDKIFSYQLKGQYKKFKNNYRKSLLVKLLGDEVVRERNIILQCAKFIVQNDFFEQKKLQSLPQHKHVLVDEQTDGEGVKENAKLEAEPDSEDVKENTISPGEADCEYVTEKFISKG